MSINPLKKKNNGIFFKNLQVFFRDKLFVLKNILDINFQETEENKKTN